MKPKKPSYLAWIASFTVACSLSAHAANDAWTNLLGGSWATAGNWSRAIPNASGDIADFGLLNLTADATVTLDGDRTVGTLNFGDVVGSHNWIVNAGTGGKLTLARTSGNGTPTINVANQTATIGAVLDGTQGLTKTGSGGLTLNGTSANTFVGGLNVLGGTLTLNYANFGNNNNLINGSNKLILGGGGKLVLSGTGTNTQAFDGLHLQGGVNSFAIGNSQTISLGAITRDTGGCINLPGGGTITTTSSNVNGIIGAWASHGVTSNARYAYWNGTKLAALTGTTAADATAMTDTTGAANYELAAGGAVAAGLSANTIRFNNTAADQVLTGAFSMNGLMNVGTTKLTISNDVTIGADRELVVPATNSTTGGITFSGLIKDNVNGSSALTINLPPSGPANVITLGTANTYSGQTTINGQNSSNGAVSITVATLPTGVVTQSVFGTGNKIALNGAVIGLTSTVLQTSDRNFDITGISGIYHKGTTTNTLTLTGNINGSGSFSVDGDGGHAGVVLAGDNGFTGDLKLQTDSKVILGSENALKNATLDLSGQRVVANLASNNLAYNIGGLRGRGGDINLGSATGGGGNGMVSIGSNNQSNVFHGSLSGTAGLNKQGTGTQTLLKTTYSGDTVVSEGTLKLGSVSQIGFTTDAASSSTTIDGVSRTQLRLAGSNIQGFVAGQTINVSGQNKTIYGVGYDTIRTYIYLTDAALGTTVASGSTGTAEALNGSIASTTIEIKSGAYLDVRDVIGFTLGSGQTLTGTGTVQGTMTVAGTLSPGNSPGTLTTDGQVWLDGADYNFQMLNAAGAAGSGHDTVAITGTLDLTSLTTGQFNLNLWSLSSIGPDVSGDANNFNNLSNYAWTILTASGGITGFDATDFTIRTDAFNGTNGFTNELDGGSFSLSQSGDNLVLNFTAATVPEPSAALLGGLSLLALLRRRRC